MGLLSFPEVWAYAPQPSSVKSIKANLHESYANIDEEVDEWDIFLSHSYADAKLNDRMVFALRNLLLSAGYTTYIDWIEDELLDRSRVTRRTARLLRTRITQCRSLLFATSATSSKSIWMPWELGFADGEHGKAAILPIVSLPNHSRRYSGQEYLGIYPYIVVNKHGLWVHKNRRWRKAFDKWLNW